MGKMTRFSLPSFAIALVCAGCSGGEGEDVYPGSCSDGLPPMVAETARLRVDDDGRLRDVSGRDVVVRGINTGNRSKWAPFVPFPIDDDIEMDDFRVAADEYFAPLPSWGLDVVRLPFSWEALEPEPGTFDDRYLERYATMVDVAWEHGLAVVVDFHQDVFTSPFCGDGFPPWLVEDLVDGPPRRDCPDWGLKYLIDPAVRTAFDRFWADHEGMQGRFRDMWSKMAGRLADHPAILAFEIVNEPAWGTATDLDAWKTDVLNPFHEAMVDHLQAEAPDVLVAYGGPGVDAVAFAESRHPDRDGVVFSPHLYDAGLVTGSAWSGEDPTPRLAATAEEGAENRVPVLLSEFGVQHGAEGGTEWLGVMMDAIDEHRISATLWEYSINEELWNSEDLSVVSATGEERPMLDAYVRPWLRAVAGTDASFSWDAERGEGRLEYESDGGITEVRVPSRRFPEGLEAVEVEGADGCYSWDKERGELRIHAPPGTRVVVEFSG